MLPGWDMGRLCRTALEGIGPVLAQEPPPSYAMQPQPRTGGGIQLAPAPTPYYPAPPPARVVPPPPARRGPPSLLPPPPDVPRAVAELAAKGGQSYARGDFTAALTSFAEASRQSSAPALLYDTGVCYKMLNRPQEALQYLQLYLDRAPTAPNRADVDALISEIRRSRGEEE